MKLCTKCNISHPKTEFHKDKRRKDGLYPYCNTCCKEYYQEKRDFLLQQKKEYQAQPHVKERYKLYKQEYYQENKDYLKEQRLEYYALVENRKKLMFFKSRERAQEEQLEFSIEVSDILIPTHCPYLGIELTHELGKGQLETNSSLDRIDSTKGYIKGNVQVISRLANTMKNNATPEQLKTFAINILKMESTQ